MVFRVQLVTLTLVLNDRNLIVYITTIIMKNGL